ncbi:MAG: N-acetylmuramoyl-L-alanine amidase [Dethiosulfovibrio peptidovorans]|nr:MAG: N-acetylmuramoyl-L-alanine amidase [Dethiosulfovibrio peptidovorans]
MIKQGDLWRWPVRVILLVLVVLWAFAAWGETWQVMRDGRPVGTVVVRDHDGEVFVSVGEMARLLDCSPKLVNGTLRVQRGATLLQVIPDAAAVWLGHEIIPLRRKAFLADQRWWMDAQSALITMEKLLAKSGSVAALRWRGQGSPEARTEDPPESTVSCPSSNPPASSRSSVPVQIRWGVHPDRVRLVLEGAEKPRYRVFKDSVRFDLSSESETRSPDPAVVVSTKPSGSRWTLSVLARGWKVHVFELTEPARVVADFLRPSESKPTPASDPSVSESLPPASKPLPSSNPSPRHPQPSKKKRPLVVIDAGHGGKDPGARGNGYKEKVLALQIAQKLAKHVQAMGMDARLTRQDDRYLRLATRTSLANKWDGDVFVSIHLNALPKGRHAKGMEIYIMALPTDKDAMALARIENAELVDGSQGRGGDAKTDMLLSILGDMQQNNKIRESTSFAEALFAAGRSGNLPMRRVAQAPFFVLRGAAMPAVLIETGFISERSEARLLAHPEYQDKIARCMSKGIKAFLR